jgi:hypothetical protein
MGVNPLSWLLDTCVYKDFMLTNRVVLLEHVLPNPCYTSELHRTKPNELGPHFCDRVGIAVPAVEVNSLVVAVKQVGLADKLWKLSDADKQLIGYGICTEYGLLTRDGPIREIAKSFGLRVWNTIDLLAEGIRRKKCTSDEAVELLTRLLNTKPPRYINRELVQTYIKRWSRRR